MTYSQKKPFLFTAHCDIFPIYNEIKLKLKLSNMKYYLAKLILKFDKFIHKNFDFLNLNKLGKFGTNYEWIFPYLNEDRDELTNKTFIEVGSRDAYDSLGLIEKFNFSFGFIFEPSYTGIIKCIENMKLHNNLSKKLALFPFGLGNRNGLETLMNIGTLQQMTMSQIMAHLDLIVFQMRAI